MFPFIQFLVAKANENLIFSKTTQNYDTTQHKAVIFALFNDFHVKIVQKLANIQIKIATYLAIYRQKQWWMMSVD